VLAVRPDSRVDLRIAVTGPVKASTAHAPGNPTPLREAARPLYALEVRGRTARSPSTRDEVQMPPERHTRLIGSIRPSQGAAYFHLSHGTRLGDDRFARGSPLLAARVRAMPRAITTTTSGCSPSRPRVNESALTLSARRATKAPLVGWYER
jgi:hypothetical protein